MQLHIGRADDPTDCRHLATDSVFASSGTRGRTRQDRSNDPGGDVAKRSKRTRRKSGCSPLIAKTFGACRLVASDQTRILTRGPSASGSTNRSHVRGSCLRPPGLCLRTMQPRRCSRLRTRATIGCESRTRLGGEPAVRHERDRRRRARGPAGDRPARRALRVWVVPVDVLAADHEGGLTVRRPVVQAPAINRSAGCPLTPVAAAQRRRHAWTLKRQTGRPGAGADTAALASVLAVRWWEPTRPRAPAGDGALGR